MGTAADPSELDTPFWAFSIAVYAGDGVAEECLSLQERLELDVNLLLFAAYMGAAEGVRLEARDVGAANAAVTAWHHEVVRPLRVARRALKAPGADPDNPLHAANATLRLQVKRAELDSEKVEQAMLWQWWRANSQDLAHDGNALTGNLRNVLTFYGDAEAPSPRLIEAALAYAAR